MPPPTRRVTTALVAVLRTLLDDDGKPVTRTATEIATLADRSDSTVGDVLARLTADGHVTDELANRKAVRSTARPIRAYTLTDPGVTYAAGVLAVRPGPPR